MPKKPQGKYQMNKYKGQNVAKEIKEERRRNSMSLIRKQSVREYIMHVEEALKECGLDDHGSSCEQAMYAEKMLVDLGLPYEITLGAMADDTFSFALEDDAFPYFWVASDDYVLDFNSGVYRPRKSVHTDRKLWSKRSRRDSKPLYEEFPRGVAYIHEARTNLVPDYLSGILVKAFAKPNCTMDWLAIQRLADSGVLDDSDIERIEASSD